MQWCTTQKNRLTRTEASIRYKQNNLGVLIAQSMLAVSPKSDAAVFNSGSIRIDDMITGVMTQLDVTRTLPFGGKLCEVELTGTLLNQMLTTSNGLKSLGGYLQLSPNITFNGNNWQVSGAEIIPSKIYRIVTPEFLFTGLEKGLEFLQKGNAEIKAIDRFNDPTDLRTDIRLAVVKYLVGIDGK